MASSQILPWKCIGLGSACVVAYLAYLRQRSKAAKSILEEAEAEKCSDAIERLAVDSESLSDCEKMLSPTIENLPHRTTSLSRMQKLLNEEADADEHDEEDADAMKAASPAEIKNQSMEDGWDAGRSAGHIDFLWAASEYPNMFAQGPIGVPGLPNALPKMLLYPSPPTAPVPGSLSPHEMASWKAGWESGYDASWNDCLDAAIHGEEDADEPDEEDRDAVKAVLPAEIKNQSMEDGWDKGWSAGHIDFLWAASEYPSMFAQGPIGVPGLSNALPKMLLYPSPPTAPVPDSLSPQEMASWKAGWESGYEASWIDCLDASQHGEEDADEPDAEDHDAVKAAFPPGIKNQSEPWPKTSESMPASSANPEGYQADLPLAA